MRFSVLCRIALSLVVLPAMAATAALWSQTPDAPVETSNLSVATVRDALSHGQAEIAAHPEDARSRIDLAYTLVDAGATSQAVREMRRAVELAPKSATVYDAQGWVLTHNSVGVQYGKGYDYEAAAAAYRRAIALDGADLDLRSRYADLLEYNRDGIRYAADAKLDEAIQFRRFVVAHQGAQASSDEVDNLLVLLFYTGRFDDVLNGIQGLAPSPKRNGIQLGALAAVKGSAAAVEAANGIAGEASRREALDYAANGLWNMRLYPQAADLLTASLPDPSGSNQLTGQIQLFRNLKPYRGIDLPPTDPRYPLQLLMVSVITGTFSESVLDRCVSHHGFVSEQAWKNSLTQANFLEGRLHTLARRTELPRVVINDLILTQLKYLAEPSRGESSRITVQVPGAITANFFVLTEDGANKILAGDDLGGVGVAALYLLNHGREDAARDLLDWKRDLTDNNQGDDPLGGPTFARLWQPGKQHNASAIKLAAASLLSDKASLTTLLPEVLALDSSATSAARDNANLLLATMYLRAEDAANARIATHRLLADHPDSLTAILLAGESYQLSKDWSGWTALLDFQLRQHPGNRLLLLQSVREAELRGDFSRARSVQRALLESGHALAVDQNNFAWLALAEDKPDDSAMQAIGQATLSTKNENAAYLNTLGCLHAARGETALARQFLLDAMAAAGVDEPNSAAWYGFGRIYEQYGLTRAALEAYSHIEAPHTPEPDSTYILAQRRVSLLSAKAAN